jgi:drug/metabolite transporter (DMT)-like permease
MRSLAMPGNRKWPAVAAFATLCVIWSSTWLVIKIGLIDLPPISYAALRFLFAFAVLVLVSVGRVPLLPKNRSDWTLLAFTGVLMFSINYGLLFWGELHVSSGLAAVLQAMIVIFGLGFAHFLLPAEPIRGQQIAGAALAVGGVALICGRLFDHGGMMAFWGGLAVLIGGAGAAFSNVLLKRRAMQLAPAMLAAWQMIFGAVPLFSLGLIVEGSPLHFHWTGRAFLCLLYLALVGSALAFLLLYWLLPRMPVNNLQTISLITPPGAVAIGWLLGGETFSVWSLLGGALVLAGVWMIFQKKTAPAGEPRECEPALRRV